LAGTIWDKCHNARTDPEALLEACTSIRANSIDSGPVRGRLRALTFPDEDPNSIPEAVTLMADYLYLMDPDSKGVSGQRFSI